jgi:hypothetical protein
MTGTNVTSKEFGEFYIRNREKFVSIAQSYVRDRQAAEDIVGDVFMSFWGGRENIGILSSLDSYMLRAVKNRALNYLRDVAGKMEKENLADTDEYNAIMLDADILSSDSLAFILHSEVSEIFRSILDSLPKRTKEIFLASRFYGKTYREIADLLGVSERIVKRDIQSALKNLRVALKDYLPIFLLAFPNFF